ncbi:MAG: DUF424 family protein [Euryarchaeota archaeon]|jgi:hypothetical protein|nr:DUF424 family protein [Euryarchaeota archaeon]
MIVNERQTPKGLLVSVCDRDILGETFENGDVSITVNEEFYGGEEVDESAVEATLARASVGNLVGEQSVSLAIEQGHVEAANVLDIDGVPHAQFLRM